MGFLDDIVAQQSGGGMMGGLPADWQYQNPETLTPVQKQMMALVGTQQGFGTRPEAGGAFPAEGAAPIAGTNSPFGMLAPPVQAQAPAPAAVMAQQPPVMPAGIPMPPISTDNSGPPIGAAAPTMVAPAVPTFGGGASPIFATPAGSTPGNPALPAMVEKPPAVAAEAAPDVNASPLTIGGKYQMPRVGPSAAFEPDPAALPINAQSTQGQGLPGPLAAAPAAAPSPMSAVGNSIGDHLKASWQSMRNGGGLIGGLSGLVTGERDDPRADFLRSQSASANMTARALVGKGVAPEVALAAVQPGNVELLKHILTQVYAPKTVTSIGEGYVADKDGKITRAYTPDKDNWQVVQTGETMSGKTFKQVNKSTGEFRDVPGTTAPAGGDPLGGDMTKSGAEYLATVPTQHRGVLKGMIDGTIQPPTSFAASKPYWQAMLAAAKQIDPTFDENNWAARRKMSTDLASSGNSSMGGILSNGQSAFKHLAEYTHSVKEQGNASHNFPLGGLIAHGQNYTSNTLGGSDTHAKVKAISDNLGHYGQESTKFYAGTGGGVEERMHALKELNPKTTSGEEAAAYAEKEKHLMVDRLQEKMKQIKDVFGEEQGNREIAKRMPDIEKSIATIDANIAHLRGQKPKTDAPADHGAPSLKIGESTTINGVSIKKVGH